MAEAIDDIIIATLDGPGEEPLIDYCRKQQWHWYRYPGDPNDVLGRYLEAARAFDVAVIVRVTSDCPLLDPGVLDGLVRMYTENPDLNFVTNNVKRTFPHGLDAEVFSTDSLARLDRIEPDMGIREHCGTHRFRNDPANFRVGNLECQANLSRYRLTVDYEEDLTMAREIFKALSLRPYITTQDVIWLIDRRPDLQKLMEAAKLRFKYVGK
jgi:spore coat polysaccharide biosynthesis protein SpsF